MSAIYISAAHKSSGKTTLSIGLSRALVERGVDPLFTNVPLRSVPVHLNLSGLPRYTIAALVDALKKQKLDKAAIADPETNLKALLKG